MGGALKIRVDSLGNYCNYRKRDYYVRPASFTSLKIFTRRGCLCPYRGFCRPCRVDAATTHPSGGTVASSRLRPIEAARAALPGVGSDRRGLGHSPCAPSQRTAPGRDQVSLPLQFFPSAVANKIRPTQDIWAIRISYRARTNAVECSRRRSVLVCQRFCQVQRLP